MVKKWKFNKTQGKYLSSGSPVFHQDSGALVGRIFPAGSEIVSDIVANVAQDSEEVTDILEDL